MVRVPLETCFYGLVGAISVSDPLALLMVSCRVWQKRVESLRRIVRPNTSPSRVSCRAFRCLSWGALLAG